MTAFDVAAWAVHALAVWWAWPWLRTDRVSMWKVALLCVLPIISWFWLVPRGLQERVHQEAELRRHVRATERRKSVAFLREQLVTGTPLEQENAREILAMWAAPEAQPVLPAANTAPIILHTSQPESVRQVGEWLVVGGTARAHVEPPSLQSYAAGCRCPACAELWSDVQRARKGLAAISDSAGFGKAMREASERIAANLSIPRAIPESSMMDCPDCDVQEIHQANGRGDICITSVVGHTCSAHGATSINWQHGHGA